MIVGGGIAGLSAGCYARMNGYKVTILEMHNIPGGLCTAWKRKGYTFDISMHLLTNSRSGPFHRMWQELNVVQGREFHYHDEAYRFESRGRSLSMTTDRRRLEEQMLALSPTDAEAIREFVDLVCGPGFMDAASLSPRALQTPMDGLRAFMAILPVMGKFRKYGKGTWQEFARKFRDPFLRSAVQFTVDSPGWRMLDFPLTGTAGFLNASVADAGVPIGGSQQVVFKIAERCRALGAEVRLRTKVADIVVENDRAVGVKLADGSELRADTVIWAADGHTVIFDLLGGRYLSDEVRERYEKWTPVKPLVHVCLGVARDMSKEPARVTYELEKPIAVAGEERTWLSVLHHSFDPTMAPAGKSAVEVWYPTDYEYWRGLASDRVRYEAEKKSIADMTIAELDRRWPGFAAQVEVVDVPTPMTYVRYTGNWKASPDGWYITAANMRSEPLRTLPGLTGFYMVGQWTAPYTGTVLAALTGRQAIQLLCRQDRKPFRTEAPTGDRSRT